MKDREIICQYYTYAGGPCQKRGIRCHFRKECQTCSRYNPRSGGRPARTDRRRQKEERRMRKEKEW